MVVLRFLLPSVKRKSEISKDFERVHLLNLWTVDVHERVRMRMRKSSIRLSILVAFYLLYVVIGASIFSAIEGPQERQKVKSLRTTRFRFLRDNKCLTGTLFACTFSVVRASIVHYCISHITWLHDSAIEKMFFEDLRWFERGGAPPWPLTDCSKDVWPLPLNQFLGVPSGGSRIFEKVGHGNGKVTLGLLRLNINV